MGSDDNDDTGMTNAFKMHISKPSTRAAERLDAKLQDGLYCTSYPRLTSDDLACPAMFRFLWFFDLCTLVQR